MLEQTETAIDKLTVKYLSDRIKECKDNYIKKIENACGNKDISFIMSLLCKKYSCQDKDCDLFEIPMKIDNQERKCIIKTTGCITTLTIIEPGFSDFFLQTIKMAYLSNNDYLYMSKIPLIKQNQQHETRINQIINCGLFLFSESLKEEINFFYSFSESIVNHSTSIETLFLHLQKDTTSLIDKSEYDLILNIQKFYEAKLQEINKIEIDQETKEKIILELQIHIIDQYQLHIQHATTICMYYNVHVAEHTIQNTKLKFQEYYKDFSQIANELNSCIDPSIQQAQQESLQRKAQKELEEENKNQTNKLLESEPKKDNPKKSDIDSSQKNPSISQAQQESLQYKAPKEPEEANKNQMDKLLESEPKQDNSKKSDINSSQKNSWILCIIIIVVVVVVLYTIVLTKG